MNKAGQSCVAQKFGRNETRYAPYAQGENGVPGETGAVVLKEASKWQLPK